MKFAAITAASISPSKNHLVLIMDEVGTFNQDWRKLKTWPGLDIVILPKQDFAGKESIKPPVVSDGFVQKLKRGLRLASKDDFLIKVFELKNTYRQATEPLMAYKYLVTHAEGFPLSWAKTITADTEGRSPNGQETIWIECSEDVTQVKALETLKELLVKRNSDEPTNVIVYCWRDEDARSYCDVQGWTFNSIFELFGSECEVKSCIVY